MATSVRYSLLGDQTNVFAAMDTLWFTFASTSQYRDTQTETRRLDMFFVRQYWWEQSLICILKIMRTSGFKPSSPRIGRRPIHDVWTLYCIIFVHTVSSRTLGLCTFSTFGQFLTYKSIIALLTQVTNANRIFPIRMKKERQNLFGII